MDLSEILIQGHTFSEFDQLFAKWCFNNHDLNMNLVQIIDLTICNAGSITPDEVKEVKQALGDIKAKPLSQNYKQLVSNVIQKVQAYIPNELAHLYKPLIIAP